MSKGEATRASILERATSLASEVGLAGLTIGRLADELGLSKSGLFAHFKSKEALEAQVLEHAAERFVETVVRPSLRAPRGEPRLRVMFERLIDWPERCGYPGGCPIIGAIAELDDRPGAARDVLVRQQKDWRDTLAGVVRSAVSEGHFAAHADPEQIAFELWGIECAYHMAHRLLRDPDAARRARTAFEALVARARASASP